MEASLVEEGTMERADPLEGAAMSSEHPCKVSSWSKQLSQGSVHVGDIAMLLQSGRVSDLSGKHRPLHWHPLISTALNELHSLKVLFEGKKIYRCYTFHIEVFNKGHLFESFLDR